MTLAPAPAGGILPRVTPSRGGAETSDPARGKIASGTPAALDYPDLYAWQQQALDRWRMSSNRGIVQAVTGSGKTRLGLAAAVDALKKGHKVLILVPTAELQGQWRRSIIMQIPGVPVGLLGNDHHGSFSESDVLVAIVNSAATREVLMARRTGLVIADECHRYAARTFSAALQDRFGWRLGLTATLARHDRADQTVLVPFFGETVCHYGYADGLKDRIIAPFDVAMIGVDLRPDERLEYDDHSEKMAQMAPYLNGVIERDHRLSRRSFHDALTLMAEDLSYGPVSQTARRYLFCLRRRKAIAAAAGAKMPALVSLSPLFSDGMKTLVFGEAVQTAEEAAARLSELGVRAATVHSNMPGPRRHAALKSFRHNNTTVLTAPRVLDEGIDVPDAELAVILSGSRTERQVVQRLGRVIRRKPHNAPGRLAYFYARDTLEDPALVDDFLPSILPFARATRTFDLPEQRDELLAFLRRPGDPDPEPAPESSTVLPPVDGTSDVHGWVLWEGEDADGPEERLTVHRPFSEDYFKDYLQAIGETPLLSAEEEVKLAIRIEAGLYASHLLAKNWAPDRRTRRDLDLLVALGRKAKELLIRANLRLVVSIAKRYSTASLDLGDIVQMGNLGLIRAVEKFDYKVGTKFSTYATWWIRQAIHRGIDDTDRVIRLPVHIEEDLNRIMRAVAGLRSTGSDPSIDEIAEKAHLAVDRVEQLLTWSLRPRSLQDPIMVDGEYYELGDILREDHIDEAYETVRFQLMQEQIHSVLDTLAEREAGIIAMRFGLTDGTEKTLDSIGQVYGVTRERIRQIEAKAMDKLRHPSRSEVLRDYL
jgi:RNA polymerase primary sigma factor